MILGIESSAKHYSLAVSDESKVYAKADIKLDKILTSSLVPGIQDVLKQAGCSLDQLNGFAIGLGPGSFTSLRVGLSTVKGMALALDKPVVGVGSLDCLAMNVDDDSAPICVVTDAKRKMVFSAVFKKSENVVDRLTEYSLTPVNDVLQRLEQPATFIGDGIGLYKEEIEASGKCLRFEEESQWLAQATALNILALPKFQQKCYDDIDTLAPLYLYPEDCQVRR